MAKRRRKPPKPQARPSARELWEHQQASIKRLTESPFFRNLQDVNRQLRESPLGRGMIERTRKDAQGWREWQERMRSPEPLPPVPSAKRRRKKGGGRSRKLTSEEIRRLQAIYKAAYRAEPKRKQHDVFGDLRKALGRVVSDTTLRRHVVVPLRPVISARRNKPPR